MQMIEDDRNEIPISDSPLDYGEQHENGVDLSLIRRNLRLSPMERLRRAEKRSEEGAPSAVLGFYESWA